MTIQIGQSLAAYAEAFGKDQLVAERITKKFKAELAKMDADDPKYDLRAISFLLDVCITF